MPAIHLKKRRISMRLTCAASSRVGVSTSTRVCGTRRGRYSRRSRIGNTNAAVLPLPVTALANTSAPVSAIGTVAAWIGVAVVKPGEHVTMSKQQSPNIQRLKYRDSQRTQIGARTQQWLAEIKRREWDARRSSRDTCRYRRKVANRACESNRAHTGLRNAHTNSSTTLSPVRT